MTPYTFNQGESPMKCEVQLYVAGQVFTETVHAVNYDEARQVALARNPNARVISVNAKF